jgi:superfamily I DNA and RNA helicase
MEKEDFLANLEKSALGTDDVLIIDEGQDFDNMFWNKIEKWKLSCHFDLYVFLDSNQSVYRSPEDLSTRLHAKHMILRINLRNTRNIAELTSKLYSGPVMQTYGPMGSSPETHLAVNANDAIVKISELVQRLINVEGVQPSSIAVLARSSSLLNRIKPALLTNRILFKTAERHGVESITLDTAYNFKGMEAPFVIIFCDKDLSNSEELSYVSASRARSHLYIVGDFRGTVLESALT